LPPPGGQRQAADPPVIGVLDPRRELLADQAIGSAACRRRRDAELVGESGDCARVFVGRLELDQDLHLAEGEAALVDHPEDLAARAAHAAQQKGAELQREVAGGRRRAALSGAGRYFHMRKVYTLATFSQTQRSVRWVTQALPTASHQPRAQRPPAAGF